MARSASSWCAGPPPAKATGTSGRRAGGPSSANGPIPATNTCATQMATIIITGAPARVSHEAVLEAAVIGKEDGDGLVKPKAFIVLKNGYGADERLFEALRAHVKERTGAWKYPRWIDIRPDLPRTATGKIQRFKLRD